MLGTKFKIVMGYRASPAINLAVEQGEVHGRAGETFNTLMLNTPTWVREKKINILVQIGQRKEPGFEQVPMLIDFARDAASRDVLRVFSDEIALGRPYLAPPGVPAERVAALRASFAATMRDPAFLADAKQIRLDVALTSGEALQQLAAGLDRHWLRRAGAGQGRAEYRQGEDGKGGERQIPSQGRGGVRANASR